MKKKRANVRQPPVGKTNRRNYHAQLRKNKREKVFDEKRKIGSFNTSPFLGRLLQLLLLSSFISMFVFSLYFATES